MALAHRDLGALGEAAAYASRGLHLARLRGNATPLVLGYRLVFDLSLDSGELDRAGELMALMNSLLEEFRLYPDSVRIIEEARKAYAERISKAKSSPDPAPPPERGIFSRRESEVLKLLAQGYTNQEIADCLFLSVGTVKTHLHNVSAKIGAGNRTEAVALARDLGYLKD
jgi:DNA-binding CsgD family transcriptional regulator